MIDGVLAYDADCYVHNGLLLYFDAIRNVGLTSEHSMDSETWANLGSVGGVAKRSLKHKAKGAGAWGKKAYLLTGGSYFKTPEITLSHQATIQIGYDIIPTYQNVTWATYFGEDSDGVQLFRHANDGDNLVFKLNAVSADPRPVVKSWDGVFATAFIDGSGAGVSDSRVAPPITFHSKSDSVGKKAYYFGGSGQNTQTRELEGSAYTVRVYDRILSNEEIARNRELDNQRFRGKWGESTEKDLVTVCSSHADADCETGNYLVRGNGSKTVTAPESVTVNGFTWTLKGYLLETMDTASRKVSYSQVDGVNSYTFTPTANGANRRLTWRYEMTKGIRTAADYDIGDYVQSGLIVNLDGIHNEGNLRAHNKDATEWVNSGSLAGSAWLNASRFYSWSDKGCVFSPAGNDWRGACAWTKESIPLDKTFTVQGAVAYNPKEQISQYPSFCGIPNDNGFFARQTGSEFEWKLNDGANNIFPERPKMTINGKCKYYTGILSPTKFVVTEGTSAPTGGAGYKSGTTRSIGAQMWSVGGSASNPGGTDKRYMKGTTYSFRIYNRELTNEELVHNRKVDEARFHGALLETNVLVAVEGDFAPTEVPGAYEVGGTWTFTANPAIDAQTGAKLQPIGRVETLDGSALLSNSVRGSAGYVWKKGDPAVKLTWRWIKSGFIVHVR